MCERGDQRRINAANTKFGDAKVHHVAFIHERRTVHLNAIDEGAVAAVEIDHAQQAADIPLDTCMLTRRFRRRNRQIAASVATHNKRKVRDLYQRQGVVARNAFKTPVLHQPTFDE